jgi:hypothetical protein
VLTTLRDESGSFAAETFPSELQIVGYEAALSLLAVSRR